MKECHREAKERGKEYECDRLNLYCETPTERRLKIPFFFFFWRPEGPSSNFLFGQELPDSSKWRWIIYLQISHVTRGNQHLSKDTNNKLFTYSNHLITLLEAPKYRWTWSAPKCSSLSKKSQQHLHHSIFKKHTFLYEKFEVGLYTLFSRKSMSNKKWNFSWMMVRPFSKIGVSIFGQLFFFCDPNDSG
jgi:hypothetical protein